MTGCSLAERLQLGAAAVEGGGGGGDPGAGRAGLPASSEFCSLRYHTGEHPVRSHGFCKLSNFALARPLGVAHAPDSGAVVGNPKYISPEQVKGARELDRAERFVFAGGGAVRDVVRGSRRSNRGVSLS